MTDIITKPFNLTRDDYNALFRTAIVRMLFWSPFGAISILFSILYWPFVLVDYEVNSETWPKFALAVAAITMFLLIIIPLFSLWIARRSLRKATNAVGMRTARLTSDCLVFEGGDFSNKMAWKTFRYVTGNRRAIYFVTRLNSGYVVLSSAFESLDQRAQFLTEARRLIAEARRKPAAIIVDVASATEPAGQISKSFTFNVWHFSIVCIHGIGPIFLRPLAALAIIAILLVVNIGMNFDDMRHDFGAFGISSLKFVVCMTLAEYAIFAAVLIVLGGPLTWLIHRNNPNFKGPRRIALNAHRVRLIAQSNDVEIGWQDIEKVTRRFGYILIFTKPRGTLVIPVSAFGDKASARAFYDQTVTWWRASRQDKTSASQ